MRTVQRTSKPRRKKYDWIDEGQGLHFVRFGPIPLSLSCWEDDEEPGKFFSSVEFDIIEKTLYATKGDAVPLEEAKQLAEKKFETWCNQAAKLFEEMESM